MLERYDEKHWSKDKAATACPEKGKPKKGASVEGLSIRVLKKAKVEKFCQKCKTYGGAHQTHNTNDSRHWDRDGKPLGQYGSKPSKKNKPSKKWGQKRAGVYDVNARGHSERPEKSCKEQKA
jgi:hypothetical protein